MTRFLQLIYVAMVVIAVSLSVVSNASASSAGGPLYAESAASKEVFSNLVSGFLTPDSKFECAGRMGPAMFRQAQRFPTYMRMLPAVLRSQQGFVEAFCDQEGLRSNLFEIEDLRQNILTGRFQIYWPMADRPAYAAAIRADQQMLAPAKPTVTVAAQSSAVPKAELRRPDRRAETVVAETIAPVPAAPKPAAVKPKPQVRGSMEQLVLNRIPSTSVTRGYRAILLEFARAMDASSVSDIAAKNNERLAALDEQFATIIANVGNMATKEELSAAMLRVDKLFEGDDELSNAVRTALEGNADSLTAEMTKIIQAEIETAAAKFAAEEIARLDDRIDGKADAATVAGLESRVKTLEKGRVPVPVFGADDALFDNKQMLLVGGVSLMGLLALVLALVAFARSGRIKTAAEQFEAGIETVTATKVLQEKGRKELEDKAFAALKAHEADVTKRLKAVEKTVRGLDGQIQEVKERLSYDLEIERLDVPSARQIKDMKAGTAFDYFLEVRPADGAWEPMVLELRGKILKKTANKNSLVAIYPLGSDTRIQLDGETQRNFYTSLCTYLEGLTEVELRELANGGENRRKSVKPNGAARPKRQPEMVPAE